METPPSLYGHSRNSLYSAGTGKNSGMKQLFVLYYGVDGHSKRSAKTISKKTIENLFLQNILGSMFENEFTECLSF